MAAPTPTLNVDKNDNLGFQNKNVITKTAYFKFGTSVSTADTILEVITKDAKNISVNDKIVMSETDSYYVAQVDKTPVKFASGTPLVTQTTNVRFPKQETKQYTPEKIATFLIFKK